MGWYGPSGKCGCCGEDSSSSEPSNSLSESSLSQSSSSSVEPIPCAFCGANLPTPAYFLTGPFSNFVGKLVITGHPATLNVVRSRDFTSPQNVTITGLDGFNGTYIIPFDSVNGCPVWEAANVVSDWFTVTSQLGSDVVTVEFRFGLGSTPTPQANVLGGLFSIENERNRTPAAPFGNSFAYFGIGGGIYWVNEVTSVDPDISYAPDSEYQFWPCVVFNETGQRLIEISNKKTIVRRVSLQEFSPPGTTLYEATYEFSLGEL